MTAPIQTVSEPLAYWSRRLALFAATFLAVSLVLHRFGQMGSAVAINSAMFAYLISLAAIVTGVLAGITIWVRGRAGAGAMAFGVLTSACMWLWPLAYTQTFLALPAINDISTDLTTVPQFGILSDIRGPDANKATYPGERFARLQAQAYPDLKTLVVDRPVEEVFELVARAVSGRRGLGWRVVKEEVPTARPPRPGWIQATEKTLVLGFVDDIVIRVAGTDAQTRVDIRSASRFGQHDMGANANRIRKFMREISSRIEATSGTGVASRGELRATRAGAGDLKRPRERSSGTAASKGGSGPAPQDARRGPEKKAPPRG